MAYGRRGIGLYRGDEAPMRRNPMGDMGGMPMDDGVYRPGENDMEFQESPYAGEGVPTEEMGGDAGVWDGVDEMDFMGWLRQQPMDMTRMLLDEYRRKRGGGEQGPNEGSEGSYM